MRTLGDPRPLLCPPFSEWVDIVPRTVSYYSWLKSEVCWKMLVMGGWECLLAMAVHIVVKGKEAMGVHVSRLKNYLSWFISQVLEWKFLVDTIVNIPEILIVVFLNLSPPRLYIQRLQTGGFNKGHQQSDWFEEGVECGLIRYSEYHAIQGLRLWSERCKKWRSCHRDYGNRCQVSQLWLGCSSFEVNSVKTWDAI